MALSLADAQARQIVAAVYLRISSDPEGRRAGVERQREDCVAECLRRGWTPVLHEDNDVSASKGRHRPAYERLLRAVERGEVQAVVAWANDRLHRSPVELEHFIDVVNRAGAQVVSVKGGDYDLGTSEGRMVARILGSVARAEVDKMSDRIKRQRLQAAQQGRPNPGGGRPFGFMPNKVDHNPLEAEAIRQAARDLIGGVSLTSVTKALGFRTTTLAKRMLTSPRVAGLVQAGTELVPAQWEPIIAREDWETLRSLLAAPQRMPAGVKATRYLLSGFLWCSVCGERMISNPSLGRRRYTCRAGFHVTRGAEALEAYVTERVLAALESPELAETLQQHDATDTDSRALADEVARLEARLAQAKKAFLVEGLISKADFTGAKKELEVRISEVRAQLAARAGSRLAGDLPIGTERIRAAWESGDLQQRRELIDVVVEKVVLRPAGQGARKLDPATVEIVWRA